MPKANPVQTNFTSGEISPLVKGRTDTTRYQNGAALIENFIVRPQGGLWRRGGAQYVGGVRNPDFAVRIQEFEFSSTQSYIAEFGSTRLLNITNAANNGSGLIRLTVPVHGLDTNDTVLVRNVSGVTNANGNWQVTRVNRNQFDLKSSVFAGAYVLGTGTVVPAKNISGITNVTNDGSGNCRVTLAAHGFQNGDTVGIAEVQGATQANGSWVIEDVTANTFDLAGSPAPSAYTSGGIAITAGGDTGYVRLWSNDNLVYGGVMRNIINVTNSGGLIQITTGTDGALDHHFVTGDTVAVDKVEGVTAANGLWTVTVTSSTQFTLNGSVFAGAYVSNTGICSADPVTLTAPYSAAQLKEIKFSQSADIMWAAHPSHPPQNLKRLGAYQWSFSKFEAKNGPYLSGQSNAVSYPITGIVKNVGGKVRILSANTILKTGNYVTIEGVTGTTEANGTHRAFRSGSALDLSDITFVNAWKGGGRITIPIELQITQIQDTAILKADVDFDRKFSNTTAAESPDGFTGTDVGKYIEFKEDNTWKLAKVLSVVDSKNALVDIEDHAIYRLPAGVELRAKIKNESPPPPTTGKYSASDPPSPTAGAGNRDNMVALNTNLSGIFGLEDRNKWIRINTSMDGSVAGGASFGSWGSFQNGHTPQNWVRIEKLPFGSAGSASRAQVSGFRMHKTGPNPDTFIGIAYDYDAAPVRWSLVGRKRTARVIAINALFFSASDVGRAIRLQVGGIWIDAVITAVTNTPPSTNYCDIQYETLIPLDVDNPDKAVDNGVVTEFKMGAWSPTSGYPSEVTFHEQRLLLASSPQEPQTVWMSISGDFPNFQPTESDGTVLDDSAITFSFASRKINKINWVQSGPVLLVGTVGGEWQIRAASSISEPLSPSNLAVSAQTTIGSIDNDTGQRIGPGILFAERGGEKLYDLTYNFELDAWQAVDMTIVSEHILREIGGAIETAYQQQPHSILWVLGANGNLASLTFNRDQQVSAWARHPMSSAGAIESLAVINDSGGNEQVLYLVARKSIGGGVVTRNILKLSKDVYSSSFFDYNFLDQYLRRPTDSSGVATGLAHLEGTSITYMGSDGSVAEGTVVSGAISTVPPVVSGNIIIGYPYQSQVTLLPQEGGSEGGTAIGKFKRIARLSAHFYKSVSAVVRDTSPYTVAAEKLDRDAAGNALFTGFREFQLQSDYSMAGEIHFSTNTTFPLTILAVYPQQWVNE